MKRNDYSIAQTVGTANDLEENGSHAGIPTLDPLQHNESLRRFSRNEKFI